MRVVPGFGKSLAVVVGLMAGLSSLPVAANEAFDAFWAKFVTALDNDDVDTVRSLFHFPMEYDGGEVGRDAFPQIYDEWFDGDARACLATTAPVEDGVDYYVAYCNLIYVFANTEDGWRFEGVDAND
jgi:hypothetical protein